MKQSTCGAVFCQPGGDELKHDINILLIYFDLLITWNIANSQSELYQFLIIFCKFVVFELFFFFINTPLAVM